MKLIGDLKKKVEKTSTKEEAREAIANAGMLLDDDELEQVSGGKTTASYWFCNCGKRNPGSATKCTRCNTPRYDDPIVPDAPDWD